MLRSRSQALPAPAGDRAAEQAPRALAALRRLIRALDLHSRQLAVRSHVTGPQLVCLAALAQETTLTATELARRVHLSPSTVVRILDRLEARALVSRQRSAEDRRRVLVSATPAGRELALLGPDSEQHPVRQALLDLPAEDRGELLRLLETLGDLVDRRLCGTVGAASPEAPGLPGAESHE